MSTEIIIDTAYNGYVFVGWAAGRFQTDRGEMMPYANMFVLSPVSSYESEDYQTSMRALAMELGCIPVVPQKSNRKNPWDYDKRLYKHRNQVERLFRRIKHFRRMITCYDKLDTVFGATIYFSLIVDLLM